MNSNGLGQHTHINGDRDGILQILGLVGLE